MNGKTFSIGEAISYGWNVVKGNFFFFLLVIIVVAILNGIPMGLEAALQQDSPGLSFLINIASTIITMVISMGVIKIALNFVDQQSAEFSDLFSCFHLIIKYFIANLIYFIIVFIGLIFFIIPGLIFIYMFFFFTYIIVDKEAGPISALKESAVITKGVKSKLLTFSFVLFGLNILGALCFLIGLLVTIPISLIASAYVYRTL